MQNRSINVHIMETWYKRTLFYITCPSGYFWILRLFSFKIEEDRRAFREEENEFLQREIKENSNNLVQK